MPATDDPARIALDLFRFIAETDARNGGQDADGLLALYARCAGAVRDARLGQTIDGTGWDPAGPPVADAD